MPLAGERAIGLSTAQVAELRKKFGPNALPEPKGKHFLRVFFEQFKSAIIYILLAALAFDLATWIIEGASTVPLESIAIALILFINAMLGALQERRAEAALAKLKSLSVPNVWVWRDGRLTKISSIEIVPGDVLRIEAGDRISADGVILESDAPMVDESVLTGESVPVEKTDRDEVFAGSLFVRGRAQVRVTRTGMQSTLGKMARLLETVEQEKTPLERRLDAFGHRIAKIVLALSMLIILVGVGVEGLSQTTHVILFAVALAVAAVPEGLPAVLTLTLARGIERMARENAVVRKMSAVEALGSVTVIATDKTGTLTENRMEVRYVEASDLLSVIRAIVLANDADPETGAGDPLESALIEFARSHDHDPSEIHALHPRKSSVPFESATKYMQVTVDRDGITQSYFKGAPETILEMSEMTQQDRERWIAKINEYAADGYRLLAVAECEGDQKDNLDFLGLVAMWDPPRPEVPQAIEDAKSAGIRVVMITGDHPATALAIARHVGIESPNAISGQEIEEMSIEKLSQAVESTNVFARVSPEHKLKIVECLKRNGEIVAMTGDGVNDAPSLKRSDVGVAMGKRGSDVAREVSDLVLLDDNFATIVKAIREGRNIYENLRKFIKFLFSTNVSLVLIVLGGMLGSVALGLREEGGQLLLPLTAVMLLWGNVITDGPPALALAFDENANLMKRKPRDPAEPLLDAVSTRFILITGAMKASIGLGLLALLPKFGFSTEEIRMILFQYACLAQLAFAYPSRGPVRPVHPNWLLAGSIMLGIAVQALTMTLPTIQLMLGVVPIGWNGVAVLTAAVIAVWILAESYTHLPFSGERMS
ncbi:MAG: cation-transporting P-type ATPase [Fimbriimonadales bacterium]|nr:cation-transporting P-type ATPase [Fimbriimonadales bacterium]